MSEPLRRSRADGSAGALPDRRAAAGADDPLIEDLVKRCTFSAPGRSLVCGVSGGADSLTLMVLAVASGCRVTAVHVDHGVRAGSEGESDVVADAARRFGASFRSEHVSVVDGPNLEARARAARLAVLGPDAAMGHTADDQAETVLANLLRGAGVNGLAAMRAGPRHPLLGLRRWETVALCGHLGLTPVHDPSNDDPRFVRNRIRHELIPLCSAISQRDVVPVLARQCGALAGDAELLDAVASLIHPADAAALAAAPEAASRRAIRGWLQGDSEHAPSLAAVERVLAVARGERRAAEIAGGRRVERSGGRLSVTPVAPSTERHPADSPVQSRRDHR